MSETKLSKSTISKLSFEEALQQLETIVRSLESGKESLEGSIDSYTAGMLLKEHCEKKLVDAKMRVEKLDYPQAEGAQG